MDRSEMKNTFDFYKDRLLACPSYGLVCGHDILKMVLRCAFRDPSLTFDDFNTIINLAEEAHIKILEVDYNEGWQ